MLTVPTLFVHSICLVFLTLTSLSSFNILRFAFSSEDMEKNNNAFISSFIIHQADFGTFIFNFSLPFYYFCDIISRHLLFYSVPSSFQQLLSLCLVAVVVADHKRPAIALIIVSDGENVCLSVSVWESESWGGMVPYYFNVTCVPQLSLSHWHIISSWTQHCKHAEITCTKSCTKSITFYHTQSDSCYP